MALLPSMPFVEFDYDKYLEHNKIFSLNDFPHFGINLNQIYDESAYKTSKNEKSKKLLQTALRFAARKMSKFKFRTTFAHERETFNYEKAIILGELHTSFTLTKELKQMLPIGGEFNRICGTFALLDQKLYLIEESENILSEDEIAQNVVQNYKVPANQEIQQKSSQLGESASPIPLLVLDIGFSKLILSVEDNSNDIKSKRHSKGVKHLNIGKECSSSPRQKMRHSNKSSLNNQDQKYSHNYPLNNKKLAFCLSKFGQSYTFTAANEAQYQAWLSALTPYVIQKDVFTKFRFQYLLGQGAFGRVFMASKSTDTTAENTKFAHKSDCKIKSESVAVKILQKKMLQEMGGNQINCLVNEIQVHWAIFECDGVLQLLEIYEDEEFIYLILEYQKQGPLFDMDQNRRKFTENQIRSVMEQLLLSVDFMHKKKIIHRDLKPDNVLINEEDEESKELVVKIADFGLACYLPVDGALIDSKCGTPSYVAPEILRGQGYGAKCDIFSLGSILFNLMSGELLFQGRNMKEMLANNKKCQITQSFMQIKGFSSQCTSLLMDLLQQDPDSRPSAETALSHDWFQGDHKAIQDLLTYNDELTQDPCLRKKETTQLRLESFGSFLCGESYFGRKVEDLTSNQFRGRESKIYSNKVVLKQSGSPVQNIPLAKYSTNATQIAFTRSSTLAKKVKILKSGFGAIIPSNCISGNRTIHSNQVEEPRRLSNSTQRVNYLRVIHESRSLQAKKCLGQSEIVENKLSSKLRCSPQNFRMDALQLVEIFPNDKFHQQNSKQIKRRRRPENTQMQENIFQSNAKIDKQSSNDNLLFKRNQQAIISKGILNQEISESVSAEEFLQGQVQQSYPIKYEFDIDYNQAEDVYSNQSYHQNQDLEEQKMDKKEENIILPYDIQGDIINSVCQKNILTTKRDRHNLHNKNDKLKNAGNIQNCAQEPLKRLIELSPMELGICVKDETSPQDLEVHADIETKKRESQEESCVVIQSSIQKLNLVYTEHSMPKAMQMSRRNVPQVKRIIVD
ncbi:hypothetical protein FGO68_gene495 [Halteria grandinella]|uniref:Protein kinase domain-containing protein n=1 Tax=Halteria grandinella TaxID=5974 RepID=A0A8J8NFR9_HALGN|nr:hypothetical protein FGO68_gene495 [Halteria grandinella]